MNRDRQEQVPEEFSEENSEENSEEISEQAPHHPDRSLWLIWGAVVLISVAALPFIARQSEWLQAIAQACLNIIR